MLHGESPYKRHTYRYKIKIIIYIYMAIFKKYQQFNRYPPILAWMMIPNITLHRLFGKFVFAIVDILCSTLIQLILRKTT